MEELALTVILCRHLNSSEPMTAIYQTAYPRIKPDIAQDELGGVYTASVLLDQSLCFDQSPGETSLIQPRILRLLDQSRAGLISRVVGLPLFCMILFKAGKEYGRAVLNGRTTTCSPD